MSLDSGEAATVLTAAAFGATPERWPLPAPVTPRQRWLRAVAASGQGRYAAARTDLAIVLRENPSDGLASLAHSTQGAFLRQLGDHAAARAWDGRALLLAGRTGGGVGDTAEAALYALAGLAADAIGAGRTALASRLLQRADAVDTVDTVDTAAPAAILRDWVRAEAAMARGDGRSALRHAESAVARSTDLGALHHQVKSAMIRAGALCCAGRIEEARAAADHALHDADRLGLVPLRWALCCLLADIGSAARDTDEIIAMRDASAALIAHRGGASPIVLGGQPQRG